jgi:glycolate oxidase FAD binding subunit
MSEIDEVATALADAILSKREAKPVYSPRTTEELAAVTRHAHANNLPIEILGNATKRTWGNPVASALLLDTTRLNRVLEHPWQDLTCTVESGCRWSDLQQTLAEHNQFVALDPLWPTRSTVGGIVATNDSGALRQRYGSLRDLVLGMTLVLADGTIARTGGKVVKNVAGYDLHKLMTGAFGTLAVIAEVTFRLHPLPLHPQTFTVSAPQATHLAPLIAAIRNSHLLTQALQLRGNEEGFHLDIQLNAHPDANQSEYLQCLVDSARSRVDAQFATFGRKAHWNFRADSPDGSQAVREALFQPDATVIKLSVPASELCDYLDHMQQAPEIEVTCVAQTIGLIYASLVGAPSAIETYLQSILPDFTILATPLKLDHWKANPDSLPLMREIKHQFDPNRILNPGRFLGGI